MSLRGDRVVHMKPCPLGVAGMWTVCGHCLQRVEEGVRSPGTGLMDGCYPPLRCWEPNLDPLEEQPVFLLADPSLQE